MGVVRPWSRPRRIAALGAVTGVLGCGAAPERWPSVIPPPVPPAPPPPAAPAPSGSAGPPLVHETPPPLPAGAYPPEPSAEPERYGSDHRAQVPERGRPFQRGEASYYHDNLAGRPTASGDPYTPSRMTAAHRDLPFGTLVDVVRENGQWVRVRVNDRGPYHGGRVIDLSRRAAEHLGLTLRGVAPVTIYVVSRP